GRIICGPCAVSRLGPRLGFSLFPYTPLFRSGSYVVSCTDARPPPPTHFLPSAASSPSHLPAGHGEKFRRTRAHVPLGTRLRRMEIARAHVSTPVTRAPRMPSDDTKDHHLTPD